MDHVLFIGSNLLACLASWSLARLLVPMATPGERALLTVGGFPIVTLIPLQLLGTLGIMTAGAACAAVGGLALTFGALAWRRRDRERRLGAEPTTTVERIVAGALLGVIALLGARLAAGHLMGVYPYHWDDYSYHGPMPAHWVQTGALGLSPYNYHAYYPGNGELFAAWFVLPVRYLSYAALTGVFWLLLAGVAAYQLARNLGVGVVGALAAVIVYTLARPFEEQAESFAAVDLAAAALVVSGVALACTPTRFPDGTARPAPLLHIGLLMGLAIGAKVTYAPIAVLTFLWLPWDRGMSWRPALRTLLVLGATAVAGGFIWYLRNWILTGNPLFPADILVFDGPLDAEARERTSLLYQWREKLDPSERPKAIAQLLAWPAPIAYGVLAAYAAALLALPWPRALRDPIGRRRLLVCLAGVLMLVVVVTGPFSGTANAKFARLQIRLRFFLPVVLLGLPLVLHWVDRVRAVRVGLPVALASGMLIFVGTPATFVLPAAAVGVALVMGWSALRERAPAWAPLVLGLILALSAIVGADRALLAKQPLRDRFQRDEVKAWNVLDYARPGSRVTWFSTFDRYKYLRAFGPALQYTPVPVMPDGSRFRFLHEYWRTHRQTWWKQKDLPSHPERLVENLIAQEIDYVVVMRRHTGGWPKQYRYLKAADAAVEVERRNNVVLYHLERE